MTLFHQPWGPTCARHPLHRHPCVMCMTEQRAENPEAIAEIQSQPEGLKVTGASEEFSSSERDRLIAERDEACPFCGGVPHLFEKHITVAANHYSKLYFVGCLTCHASAFSAETGVEAWARWHRRMNTKRDRRVALGLRLGQILGPEWDGASFEEVAQRLVQAESQLTVLRGALEAAKQFIENGIEFGFIRLPSGIDPAHDTLPKIRAALARSGVPQREDRQDDTNETKTL